jgi:hypothetical protein
MDDCVNERECEDINTKDSARDSPKHSVKPNRPTAMSRSMTGLISLIDPQVIDTTLKAEPLLSF